MKQISTEVLGQLLKQARVKSRLIKDLRFQPEAIVNWGELELLAIFARSHYEGVLLISPSEVITVVPFTLSSYLTNTKTGRTKPAICDFCYTYQGSGGAARITFMHRDSRKSISFLCCADLRCSLHVRDQTFASTRSRTQLHEDMTPEQRVARLQRRLQQLIVNGLEQ